MQTSKCTNGNSKTSLPVHSDLIFDIGMHVAADTEFYLRKGFRVVAVEANPIMVSNARDRLSEYIAKGQLIIENVGISETDSTAEFYINEDNDEWSSFNKSLGTRNNTRFRVERVECVRAATLYKKYGLPHFLKIDIEGLDYLPVEDLLHFSSRPNFLSVEDNGFESLLQLYGIGARRFKLVDQVEKWRDTPPNPALEGNYVEAHFGSATSGLFGRELPGDWMKIDQASEFYLRKIRPPQKGLIEHWWDIHVAF